jgi:hypothetical protein
MPGEPSQEPVTGRFDAAYCADFPGRVRGVLIAVADAFPAQQVGLVDEAIDANEAGVALEGLVGMLDEAHTRSQGKSSTRSSFWRRA